MKIRMMRSSLAMSAIFALAAVAAFAQGAPQTDYAHMTMKVDKLADNFYTVTGMNGSGRTGGAIGVLTGPDGIFMVDATFGPLSGKVTAAIKTFSNEPIKFLINTHPHGDHTGGNPNFAKMGVTILGRPEMVVDLMALKGFDQAGLPTVIFTSPLTLHMDGDDAVIIPVPPAHTDADSMVYFRKADVLMIGDFFRAGYPNVGGTVDGMIRALGMAIGVCGPNTKVVPGHGPVMNRADIIAHKDMLTNVRDRVSELIKQGKSEDEVVAAHPTASYDPVFLSGIAQFYDENTIVRYRNGDAFIKQVYENLKPKS
jgi:cyclase